MKNIYDFTPQELEQYFISIGDKPYRARQIYEWLYRKKVTRFIDMTNLSKIAQNALSSNFEIKGLTLNKRYESIDGTVKYLFTLSDGNIIETVLMRHNYGNSVCITSEVGCNMGCSFCASGELGCIRKLTLSEMILQVLYVDNELNALNQKVTNIVVMGIGEPFDNYDNLIRFLKSVNYPLGLEIGARHITVSTSGIVPRIIDFSDFDLQVNLAISLHAPNNKKRSLLMKINKRYPIEDVIDAVKYYIDKTNRRVTFEYILINNVNDSKEDALELVKLVRGINCYINLIPYNEVKTNDYVATPYEKCEEFFKVLYDNKINATLRKKHGDDVSAACGQLRAKAMKER